MKYLKSDIYWIHDAHIRNEFKLVKIESINQLADLGTKLNPADKFFSIRNKLMKYFL
jgi:hypothetical protein